MALQNKLKAFVRFDGSGRVIPSSLILQKSKPKVGNWKEINAKECCNYTPGTTTTTSTSNTTSTTTTTQVQSYVWQALYSDVSKSEACSGQYIEIYTSTPYLSDNINIYLNSSLTQPVLYNYISSGGRVWQCMSGFIYGEQNCASLTTTTTTTFSGNYTVGQSALGGIVAYILQPSDPGYDANVQHGLIVSNTDAATSNTRWGCYGVDLPGASSTTIGSGPTNTQSIADNCSDIGIAAKICIDYTDGGYNDWYLPSRDELSAIVANKAVIGGFNNGLPFGAYWTSTQASAGSAYYYAFTYNSMNIRDKFESNSAVRPVRSF